jgi:hypothetical protein
MARTLARKTPRNHLELISMNENIDRPEPILPRSAWESQIAYLRAVFRAKKALDEIERVQNEKT